MGDTENEYKGSCYCGAVDVTVTGEPAAAALCHCESCRKWHAAPINAWCIWPAANVTISGPTVTSDTNEASGRVSCEKCGGCVANHKPAVNMTVVYAQILAGSGMKYQPAFHIFYDERVADFADGLPKFSGTPEAFGGTGEMVDEPERTSWAS